MKQAQSVVVHYLFSRKRKPSCYFRPVIFFILNVFFPVCSSAQLITVKVTFASTPSSARSSFADLKYDKQSVFNFEMDDRPLQIMDVFAYLAGGAASRGTNYSGKFFTDGCGNKIAYRAAVAVNAKSNWNDGDLNDGVNHLTAEQLGILTKAGFLVENHGYYHDQDRYYVTNKFTLSRNIDENTKYIYGLTGFKPRVWVTPSNYAGYNKYVEQLGYLAASSQSVSDEYPPIPANMWTDHLGDLSDVKPFNVFLRDFSDQWNDTTQLKWFKAIITSLKEKSSAQVHKIWRLGTHGINNWPAFTSLMDHLEKTSDNTIWVTTLQEMLEYIEVRKKAGKTESLNKNILTIHLDLTSIPADAYFRDMSLKIKGGEIRSVAVTGADGYSYNKSGLINIFKKGAEKQKGNRPTGK